MAGLCLIRLAPLFALLLSTPASAACRPERRAEVPVRVIEGFPIVPATIGDAAVSLLLDTGAQGNLLLPDAIKPLGLHPTPGVTTRVIGPGGAVDVPTVVLTGLRLGGTALPPTATPIAPLPGTPTTNPPLVGLIGAAVLSIYDLELDVPAGRVTLYEAQGCSPASFRAATVLPMDVSPRGEGYIQVQIDGQTFVALLDTGSRATLLTQGAARRLGVAGPISANTARGVDGERLSLQHVRVREMRVGADVRTDVPLSIAPLQLGPADMLLGLDYLGQRRVLISYVTRRVAIAVPGPPASAR